MLAEQADRKAEETVREEEAKRQRAQEKKEEQLRFASPSASAGGQNIPCSEWAGCRLKVIVKVVALLNPSRMFLLNIPEGGELRPSTWRRVCGLVAHRGHGECRRLHVKIDGDLIHRSHTNALSPQRSTTTSGMIALKTQAGRSACIVFLS
jgi:hypothetical protein